MSGNHLSLGDNLRFVDVLDSIVKNNGTTLSSAIDMQGWDGILVLINVGVTDTTVDMAVQTATTSGASYSTVTGASITQYTSTDDNKTAAVDLYRPTNEFVKVLLTVGNGTTGASVSIQALQYRHTGLLPSTNNLKELVKVAQN